MYSTSLSEFSDIRLQYENTARHYYLISEITLFGWWDGTVLKDGVDIYIYLSDLQDKRKN